MDGTGYTPIITKKVTWPNGLAVDYTTKRIFWADARQDRIEFADYDGGNRYVLYL